MVLAHVAKHVRGSLTTRYRPSGAATHPSKAGACSPAETHDHRQAATQTRRRTAAPTRCQTQAQAQARRHHDSADPALRGRPLRPPARPSQTGWQQRPARRPPTVTDAAATTFMVERAAAEARRTSSHLHSKPAPQAHRPPPTGPEQRQGQPAASPPPYQPLMSAHIRQMPRYRRPRGSQPNPEAETVSAYPRVRVRSLYPTLQSFFCHSPIYQRHLWGNAREQKIPYHGSPPLDGPHLQKAACQPQASHPTRMPIQFMPVWQQIALSRQCHTYLRGTQNASMQGTLINSTFRARDVDNVVAKKKARRRAG